MGLAVLARVAVADRDNAAAVGRDDGVHRDSLAGRNLEAIEPGHAGVIPYEEGLTVRCPAINGILCAHLREFTTCAPQELDPESSALPGLE
jgi:hypothetical protein